MNDNLNNLEQPKTPERTGDRLWPISITSLVFATLITITSRTIVDADLWGHLRYGLDNIQAGIVSQVDPYSYLTAGVRWINHEWLAEVVFALVWLAGKVTGLVLLKTFVGILTLGLVYWYLLSQKVSPIRAGCLVILGWFGLMTAITTVRPHMFTLLFSAVLFIIIAKAESGQYRWLWLAPPVLLLWINFHGGVLAGLGFLIIWAFVHMVLNHHAWKQIIPPVVLSFIALLVNPYGPDLVIFLFSTATVPRPEIIEWHPLEVVSLLGGIYLVLLVITILGLVFSKRKKSIPIVVLLFVAALLPFTAFRHLPIFTLAVLVLAGPYIDDAWSRISPSRQTNGSRPRWISIVSLVLGLVLFIWSLPNFQRIVIPNQPEPFFPDRAVTLITESQVIGNLAVEFNWGQYVLWHLGPQVQVSMDGRRETVYPDDIYKINREFVKGVSEWDTLLENYNTQMALVYHSGAARNLIMFKENWELIYEDGTSALFASQGWPGIDLLKQAIADNPNPPVNDSFP